MVTSKRDQVGLCIVISVVVSGVVSYPVRISNNLFLLFVFVVVVVIVCFCLFVCFLLELQLHLQHIKGKCHGVFDILC